MTLWCIVICNEQYFIFYFPRDDSYVLRLPAIMTVFFKIKIWSCHISCVNVCAGGPEYISHSCKPTFTQPMMEYKFFPPYRTSRRHSIGGTPVLFTDTNFSQVFFPFKISKVSLTNTIYLQTNNETIMERPVQHARRATYPKQTNKHRVFMLYDCSAFFRRLLNKLSADFHEIWKLVLRSSAI